MIDQENDDKRLAFLQPLELLPKTVLTDKMANAMAAKKRQMQK